MSKRTDRSAKPAATGENIKQILGSPARKLTPTERKARVDFYADNPNVQASAVEPSTFARNPR
jgi:hypothetical protein